MAAPPDGADIQVLENLRVLPELRRHFHDDMILLRTEGIVDGGDLRLGKGVAQRIVDLNLRQAQARGAVAIHDQVGLETAGLQIGIHIGDLRHVLQRCAQLLRPGAQFGQIIAQQGELILRVGRSAAAAAEVLHGLQEGRSRPQRVRASAAAAR